MKGPEENTFSRWLKKEFTSYDEQWRSEVYKNISATDRVQLTKLNQLKPKFNETYKKDENITTKFEAVKMEMS